MSVKIEENPLSRKSSRRQRLVRAVFYLPGWSKYYRGGSHADIAEAARGARCRAAAVCFVAGARLPTLTKKSSSMPSGQQSISPPLVVGEPLVGGFPTDMDIDDDNLGLLDAHDAPSEKVDADFFNGELCHCARTLTPPALRRPPRALPSVAHMSSRRLVPHRFRGRLR